MIASITKPGITITVRKLKEKYVVSRNNVTYFYDTLEKAMNRFNQLKGAA